MYFPPLPTLTSVWISLLLPSILYDVLYLELVGGHPIDVALVTVGHQCGHQCSSYICVLTPRHVWRLRQHVSTMGFVSHAE